jgi:hypothetical protein
MIDSRKTKIPWTCYFFACAQELKEKILHPTRLHNVSTKATPPNSLVRLDSAPRCPQSCFLRKIGAPSATAKTCSSIHDGRFVDKKNLARRPTQNVLY